MLYRTFLYPRKAGHNTMRMRYITIIPLFLTVPEGGCSYTVVDQGKEGLLHQQLRIKDDQLGRGRDQVVAAVETKELGEYLNLVVFYKENLFIKQSLNFIKFKKSQ